MIQILLCSTLYPALPFDFALIGANAYWGPWNSHDYIVYDFAPFERSIFSRVFFGILHWRLLKHACQNILGDICFLIGVYEMIGYVKNGLSHWNHLVDMLLRVSLFATFISIFNNSRQDDQWNILDVKTITALFGGLGYTTCAWFIRATFLVPGIPLQESNWRLEGDNRAFSMKRSCVWICRDYRFPPQRNDYGTDKELVVIALKTAKSVIWMNRAYTCSASQHLSTSFWRQDRLFEMWCEVCFDRQSQKQ
jgi:hypothetical protein